VFLAITKKALRAALAFYLFGLICGAAGTMLFTLELVDSLYIERDTLASELSESRVRIELLEQSLSERRTRVVRSVAVQLDAGDQHLTLKLTGAARELLDGLIGQEVAAVDPTLVQAIFHRRILTVEQHQFEVNLKYLVISDIVTVNLDVTKRLGP
jgi:hypothetical protein